MTVLGGNREHEVVWNLLILEISHVASSNSEETRGPHCASNDLSGGRLGSYARRGPYAF